MNVSPCAGVANIFLSPLSPSLTNYHCLSVVAAFSTLLPQSFSFHLLVCLFCLFVDGLVLYLRVFFILSIHCRATRFVVCVVGVSHVDRRPHQHCTFRTLLSNLPMTLLEISETLLVGKLDKLQPKKKM